MTMRGRFVFPPEQAEQRERAKRYAWLSVVLLVLAGSLLFITVGGSQAMKTAWVSDFLTAVPSAAMLIAMRIELHPPTARFPFGYFRAVAIAFLVTASMLLASGVYLFFDSALKLVHGERPPVGTMVVLGHQFWAGWAMIAALAISLVVGLTIGKLKEPVAESLHSKELEAESRMNRDEWMSEGAAIIGLLLVGYGHWWADAAAATFISLEMISDGWHNLRQVIADLMDESPSQLGKTAMEDLPRRVKEAAERADWVDRASVRLREQGHIVSGDVFVVPSRSDDLVRNVEGLADELASIDWRLHGIAVMPVSHLDGESPVESL